MKNLYFPNTSSLEESIWIIIHKKYYFYLNIKKINTCNKIFQNISLKIHNYPRVMILKIFPNINIPIPSIKWSQKKALQLYVACDTIHSYSFEVNTKGVYRNEKYEGYLTFDSGSLSFFLLFFPPPERTRTLSRPFEIGWFTRVLGDEPDCHIWFASGTYCNTGGGGEHNRGNISRGCNKFSDDTTIYSFESQKRRILWTDESLSIFFYLSALCFMFQVYTIVIDWR